METVRYYARWLLVYLAVGALIGVVIASKDKRFTDANGNSLMTGLRQPQKTHWDVNPLHKHPVVDFEYVKHLAKRQ